MAKLLDSRTMDIARTAGISALAASVSDNLFENLSIRYGKESSFLDSELKKQGIQVAIGVGLLAFGGQQRKRGSGQQVGEILSTVGIGMITAGVYNYTSPELATLMADLPLVGRNGGNGNGNGKDVKDKDDKSPATSLPASPPTSTSTATGGQAGYTMLPSHDYTPVQLQGYQATPSRRADETQIHLGDAGIQSSELNTYQVVS